MESTRVCGEVVSSLFYQKKIIVDIEISLVPLDKVKHTTEAPFYLPLSIFLSIGHSTCLGFITIDVTSLFINI